MAQFSAPVNSILLYIQTLRAVMTKPYVVKLKVYNFLEGLGHFMASSSSQIFRDSDLISLQNSLQKLAWSYPDVENLLKKKLRDTRWSWSRYRLFGGSILSLKNFLVQLFKENCQKYKSLKHKSFPFCPGLRKSIHESCLPSFVRLFGFFLDISLRFCVFKASNLQGEKKTSTDLKVNVLRIWRGFLAENND